MPVAANQKLAGVTEKDKETTGREMNLSTNKRLASVKIDLLRQLALEGLLNRGVSNLTVVEGLGFRFGLLDAGDVHNGDDLGALNHLVFGSVIRFGVGVWHCASQRCSEEDGEEFPESAFLVVHCGCEEGDGQVTGSSKDFKGNHPEQSADHGEHSEKGMFCRRKWPSFFGPKRVNESDGVGDGGGFRGESAGMQCSMSKRRTRVGAGWFSCRLLSLATLDSVACLPSLFTEKSLLSPSRSFNLQPFPQLFMKKLWLLPLSLTTAVLFCGEIPLILAQDATPTEADDTLPLEKLPERIKQIDDDFKKRAGAFVAVVDAEAAAKRISDTFAQLLRALALAPQFNFNELSMNIPQKSGAISAEQPDPGTGAPGVRSIPPRNEAIYAASKELEAAAKLQQIRINAVISDFSKVLSQRLNAAVLGMPKPEELATLIQTIERIQGTMRRRMLSISTGNGSVSSENLLAALKAVKQLVEADNAHSATAVPAAIAAFRNGAAMRGELFKQDEIRDLITRYLEPMRKATEEQGIAIEAMIEAHKPAQQIATAVENYTQAVKQFNSLLTGADYYNGTGPGFSEATADFYRHVATALRSLENSEYEAADRSLKDAAGMERQQFAPSSIRNRRKSGGDSEARAQIVGKLQKELAEKFTKLREQTKADINTRISTLKDSAEITALILEIEKRARPLRMNSDGSTNDELGQLNVALRELQRAWAANSAQTIARLDQQIVMIQQEPLVAFRKEFTALQNRIRRTLFVDIYKAPELNAPPYLDKDPDAAVEAFCDDLVLRGDWRRLLGILQSRTPVVVQRTGPKEDETILALRSYLSGKNSELAEQWVDAVLAYKVVLRSTATRAPIQPAAESIKAIAKAHPEAIAEAATREKTDVNAPPTEKPSTKTSAPRPVAN